jgi:hypothetical protein
MNQALYAHMNNKRKMKKKKNMLLEVEEENPCYVVTESSEKLCPVVMWKVEVVNDKPGCTAEEDVQA